MVMCFVKGRLGVHKALSNTTGLQLQAGMQTAMLGVKGRLVVHKALVFSIGCAKDVCLMMNFKVYMMQMSREGMRRMTQEDNLFQ